MASFRQRSNTTVAVVIVIVLVIFIVGFLIGYFTSPKRSGEDDSCNKYGERRRREEKKKEAFHEQLYDSLDAKEIGKNLKYFSQRPHIAGTARSEVLADEIQRRWLEYGFDKVEQPKYNILLPYVSPNVSNKVQILKNSSVTWEFSGKEKLADPSEDDPTMIAPLLAFAKPGAAEGPLLYVNYGRTEDFDYLKSNLSIPNCNGSIVIMRYGEIFRGDKVKNAQECGAVGAILYNDPKDFAPFGQNRVYPHYIWLPKTGVQRGSIYGDLGDPLTPGLPSIDGIYRIPQEKAKLPKIPATPMPYGEAEEVLKLMRGKDVPESWKGDLGIAYKLGDGGLAENKTIRIEVNVPNKRQDVYNVIGTIYGKEEPDRWVMIGNHRDAWGFGAVDASSGTSAMMEISRGLKELLKTGWRPRRTIKFCSWGAEEAGVIGSTEWVEENERALSTKGITYINVDVSVAGNHTMVVSGSPLFQTLVFDETKKVEDPHVKKTGEKETVYERILETSYNRSIPDYHYLSSGSDYVSFYQFVGVPAVDMYYFGKRMYPVYHSVHDTYKWLQGLVDPDFAYHLTTTRLASRLLMNAADSFVLPFDVTKYGQALTLFRKIKIEGTYGAQLEQNNITFNFIESAIQKFVKQAEKFEKEKENALDSKSDLKLRDLNDRMVNVEKAFIYSLGRPNKPYERHVVFAPSSNNIYGSTIFPGISDLLFPSNKTEEDWENLKRQVSILFKAISEATEALSPDRK